MHFHEKKSDWLNTLTEAQLALLSTRIISVTFVRVNYDHFVYSNT